MSIHPEILALQIDMRRWRRQIHQYPETAFEETATARMIAAQLQQAGIEVHQGLAKTGIVGILRRGNSTNSIALRADMDALYIQEQNRFEHASCNSGKMHACGHDGHCAMLLGAAHYLANHGRFDGTVYFIFQPAEECRAGAHQMISEGLFEQFPAQRVFGMHNFPDIPVGHFAVKAGPMMASFDCFEINLSGQGTHAAMPHLGNDVLVAAAHLITQLQTIVSRQIDPADAAVVSVTQIHGGNTWNALPDSAVIRGTFRSFKDSVRVQLEQGINHLAQSVTQKFRVSRPTIYKVIELARKQEFSPRKSTNKRFSKAKYGMKRLAKVEFSLEIKKKLAACRYNKSYPGEMVHFDTKFLTFKRNP